MLPIDPCKVLCFGFIEMRGRRWIGRRVDELRLGDGVKKGKVAKQFVGAHERHERVVAVLVLGLVSLQGFVLGVSLPWSQRKSLPWDCGRQIRRGNKGRGRMRSFEGRPMRRMNEVRKNLNAIGPP